MNQVICSDSPAAETICVSDYFKLWQDQLVFHVNIGSVYFYTSKSYRERVWQSWKFHSVSHGKCIMTATRLNITACIDVFKIAESSRYDHKIRGNTWFEHACVDALQSERKTIRQSTQISRLGADISLMNRLWKVHTTPLDLIENSFRFRQLHDVFLFWLGYSSDY